MEKKEDCGKDAGKIPAAYATTVYKMNSTAKETFVLDDVSVRPIPMSGNGDFIFCTSRVKAKDDNSKDAIVDWSSGLIVAGCVVEVAITNNVRPLSRSNVSGKYKTGFNLPGEDKQPPFHRTRNDRKERCVDDAGRRLSDDLDLVVTSVISEIPVFRKNADAYVRADSLNVYRRNRRPGRFIHPFKNRLPVVDRFSNLLLRVPLLRRRLYLLRHKL